MFGFEIEHRPFSFGEGKEGRGHRSIKKKTAPLGLPRKENGRSFWIKKRWLLSYSKKQKVKVED